MISFDQDDEVFTEEGDAGHGRQFTSESSSVVDDDLSSVDLVDSSQVGVKELPGFTESLLDKYILKVGIVMRKWTTTILFRPVKSLESKTV